MRHLSSLTAHSHIAAAAVACLVAAACSDRAPTDPTSAFRPGAASADRNTPTFDYQTIDVAGAFSTSLQGINAGGDLSGSYVDATHHLHGFVLSNGVFTTIDYPGADNTSTNGIGPDGEVVGAHWNDNEPGPASHGYVRTADGAFIPVHYPGHLNEVLQRILPDGTILGCRHDQNTSSTMRGVRINPDGTASEIDAFSSMNNGGTPDGHRLVGFYMDMAAGLTEGYVIDDGVFTPFVVPGSSSTTAWDVNARGDIVGAYQHPAGVGHGYVRTGDDTYTTLDFPGATLTQARGINARGDIVGVYVAGGKTHGFLAVRQ
jgi:hypothetical protein